MILLLAYAAVLLSLLSGLLALLMRYRNCLINLKQSATFLNPVWQQRLDAFLEEQVFPQRLQQLSFIVLGLAGVCAVAAGLTCLLSQQVITDQLSLGLPWLPWHVRFDSLSAFFYLIIGIAVCAVSLYGPGYVSHNNEQDHPFGVLGLFTGLFIAGMLLVLLADDAFFFMIAWEVMSVASYFLVAFQHENPANRRAAFLYLMMAEVGAISIILAYGVLASFSENYNFTFDALRAASLTDTWANIAFVMALLGFGMKAGLVPIHVWLPEAHPVAPSHISALMSGVMLKVAVYGLIRFTYDLLGGIQWEWGLAVLIIGAVSSVFGVLYALMQHNLKRLLAYHSVENIGIIFIGLGLSMIFFSYGHEQLGVLGLVAALFHTLNHALFKSLLFLGAGVIIHQTRETDIERMGGLIHRMPKTSVLFLIGCMAISALPPLNGFVSEWLTFQAALQADVIESGVIRSLIPVSAAALALAAALAAACFVKVFGTIFLGLPRSGHCAKAQEIDDNGVIAGMGMLAGLCLLIGIFPGAIIALLNTVSVQLMGQTLPNDTAANWLWLAPVSAEQASYAAPLVFLGILVAGGISYWYLRRDPEKAYRRADTWDCGFGGLTPRMQYTSTSFSMPIRRIFSNAWQIEEQINIQQHETSKQQVTDINYKLHVQDHFWVRIYLPIERGVNQMARLIGRIQTGSIRVYLGYSFVTLILLLWVIS
ncbi:MAG TPA: hydrogenase 4 subunit B [Crenotrichaceae bacterium]|nr:hydrogenase 4 subunit B [Crenotrichaceae bacterium]